MDLMLQVSNFLPIFFVFNGIDENKYAYKNFKSIHTIILQWAQKNCLHYEI